MMPYPSTLLKKNLYTACITPFYGDGTIDYESMRILIHKQDQVGNGLLLLASTGESLSLTLEEKESVLSFALSCMPSVPILVGVQGYDSQQAQQWISIAQSYPISGFLLTCPLYAKPGLWGQIAWFETLLKASGLPCMLYNIPGRAGVRLLPEVLDHIGHHPLCWAIKDSGGSLDTFMAYKTKAPHMDLYCGDDDNVTTMIAHGACGLISVAANAWPELTQSYVNQCLAGLIPGYTPLWWQVCKALFAASNPIPIKALLNDMGLIHTPILRPPLAQKDFSTQDRTFLWTLHHQLKEITP